MKICYNLALLLVIIATFSFGVAKLENKYWSINSSLKWSDFKFIKDSVGIKSSGKFKINTEPTAISYTFILLDDKHFFDSSIIKIHTVFDCNRSWTKSLDTNLLKHEQLHFDISELYARRLRKVITNELNLNTKFLDSAYISINKLLVIEQSKYDSLSQHGMSKLGQQHYQNYIDSLMNTMKDYIQPRLFVRYKH